MFDRKTSREMTNKPAFVTSESRCLIIIILTFSLAFLNTTQCVAKGDCIDSVDPIWLKGGVKQFCSGIDETSHYCKWQVFKDTCPKSCGLCETSPPQLCRNSDLFILWSGGQKKGCRDVNTSSIFCTWPKVQLNCPKSCGLCEFSTSPSPQVIECTNSKDPIYLKGGKKKYCNEVNEMSKYCTWNIFRENCPKSCGSCNLPKSIPSDRPSIVSNIPSFKISLFPTSPPSISSTNIPSVIPSSNPTSIPSSTSITPSDQPTKQPSKTKSSIPSSSPSIRPSEEFSDQPTVFSPFSLLPIKSASSQWERAVAFSEVETDLERFGYFSYSEEGLRIKKSNKIKFDMYEKDREKVVKEIAILGKVYAGLLNDFPDISKKLRDKFYGSMMDIALMINATYIEMKSYVEDLPMRGWPFKIKSTVLEFEAYQAGNLMEAVALAAEQAALNGDTETAISLALTVASALHDSFLTKDLRRTKVRGDGSIVYVPQSAPEDRKIRFKKLYEKKEGQATYECPEQPQATNHGLAAASAGVGLLRAFGAINWLEPTIKSKSSWRLIDADGNSIMLENYVDDLKQFVFKSADVVKNMCSIRETGMSIRDNYVGPNGTEWCYWKYRKVNVTKCPSFDKKNDSSNRPEDIIHSKVELQFASDARAVGKDYFKDNPDYFGVSETDIHRFLVAVLNRFINAPEVDVDDRFACDLGGENKSESKACSNSRIMPGRILKVSDLLNIANAARGNPKAVCDCLSLVNTILPIYLEGNKDFQGRFRYGRSMRFYLEPLKAKYHFYWYKNSEIEC